jgi:hypothetical protein
VRGAVAGLEAENCCVTISASRPVLPNFVPDNSGYPVKGECDTETTVIERRGLGEGIAPNIHNTYITSAGVIGRYYSGSECGTRASAVDETIFGLARTQFNTYQCYKDGVAQGSAFSPATDLGNYPHAMLLIQTQYKMYPTSATAPKFDWMRVVTN